jgi:hypothetical protein
MIAKDFIIAKLFRAHSANFLRQDKSIRDHGGARVARCDPPSRERADASLAQFVRDEGEHGAKEESTAGKEESTAGKREAP